MKENLEEMNARGVKVPVLLGGAALTRDYAEDDLAGLYGGPLLYCKDAFDGLHMMDAIAGGQVGSVVTEQKTRAQKRKRLRAESEAKYGATIRGAAADVPKVAADNPVPCPPFWGRRVVKDLNVRHVFPFINEDALFKGQWGFGQGKMGKEQYARFLDEKARPVFEQLQRRALDEGFLEPRVVYGYFPVQSRGNDLVVYHVEEFDCAKCGCGVNHNRRIEPHKPPREWLRFSFPRQEGRRRLCISDFFRSAESGQYDVMAVQLVTVGDKATEMANALRAENRYQDYLFLHGFGVESAEALAEFWHKRVRQELGFGSEDDPSVRKLFQQGYRGSRYSFGYPACPDLEDRAKIADLLRPEDIGVSLSENFMLVPEQSTDALIAHHPQAKYFDVKGS
jgi:5-methyltetrahydrofolate--homocysteine methyltransferase